MSKSNSDSETASEDEEEIHKRALVDHNYCRKPDSLSNMLSKSNQKGPFRDEF